MKEKKKISNLIQEPFCSVEISKLLKKKGFDCQCDMLHIGKEKHNIHRNLFKECYGIHICTNSQIQEYSNEYGFKNYLKGKEIITIPTHALAIEWIRINFGYHINTMYMGAELKYSWSIDVISTADSGWTSFGPTEEEEKDVALRKNSSQESVEFALKYALTELIK